MSPIIITIITGLLGIGFKLVPNKLLKGLVTKFFYGLGVAITLGLSKWAWTAPLWNKLVEPFVIDLIDNIVGGAIEGLIKGLRSDNE